MQGEPQSPVKVHQTLVTGGVWLPLATTDIYRVVVVRRGAGLARMAGLEFAIPEQGMLLMPRNTALEVAASASPFIVVCLDIAASALTCDADLETFMSDLLDRWPPGRVIAPADSAEQAGLLTALRAMAREQGRLETAARIALRSQALAFLVKIHRISEASRERDTVLRRDDRFERSLRHIEANIAGRLAIVDLARMAGVSYRRYTELFRERMGSTAATYIRAMRVQYAKERLLETGDIVQASLDSGFNDLSNFYRVFRAESGFTPKQYIGRNGGRSPIITL